MERERERERETRLNISKVRKIHIITLDVTFGALIVWCRDLSTKKFGAEVFGELRYLAQDENGEDKIPRRTY